MQYNEEEGTVRMYLRGRPVVLYVPTPMIESYDLHKVNTPPQSKLKLDWVYGYRGRDCRSNLHLLPTGEIVYFVAAVVVLYNMEEHSQRHYLGHTDDVKWWEIKKNAINIMDDWDIWPLIRRQVYKKKNNQNFQYILYFIFIFI